MGRHDLPHLRRLGIYRVTARVGAARTVAATVTPPPAPPANPLPTPRPGVESRATGAAMTGLSSAVELARLQASLPGAVLVETEEPDAPFDADGEPEPERWQVVQPSPSPSHLGRVLATGATARQAVDRALWAWGRR